MRIIGALLFAIVFSGLPAVGAVRFDDPAYDEFEGLPLAEILSRDGRHAEAKAQLASLSGGERKGPLFLRIEGEILFAEGKFDAALAKFKTALGTAAVADREPLWIWIARSQDRMDRAADCAESFARVSNPLPAWILLIRAECENKAGKTAAAWSSLTSSDDAAVAKARLEMLLRLGLVGEALRVALERGARAEATPGDLLTTAETFEKHRRTAESFQVLEFARTRFPAEKDVLLAWAQIAYTRGLAEATANAFATAALTDPKFHYHAAEILRQLGHYERSRYLNRFIPDAEERLKQSVALHVDMNRWDLIAALEGPLSRGALARNDEINYALAYSLMRRKDGTPRVPTYLDRITRPEFLVKATALREAWNRCRDDGWACR